MALRRGKEALGGHSGVDFTKQFGNVPANLRGDHTLSPADLIRGDVALVDGPGISSGKKKKDKTPPVRYNYAEGLQALVTSQREQQFPAAFTDAIKAGNVEKILDIYGSTVTMDGVLERIGIPLHRFENEKGLVTVLTRVLYTDMIWVLNFSEDSGDVTNLSPLNTGRFFKEVLHPNTDWSRVPSEYRQIAGRVPADIIRVATGEGGTMITGGFYVAPSHYKADHWRERRNTGDFGYFTQVPAFRGLFAQNPELKLLAMTRSLQRGKSTPQELEEGAEVAVSPGIRGISEGSIKTFAEQLINKVLLGNKFSLAYLWRNKRQAGAWCHDSSSLGTEYTGASVIGRTPFKGY